MGGLDVGFRSLTAAALLLKCDPEVLVTIAQSRVNLNRCPAALLRFGKTP